MSNSTAILKSFNRAQEMPFGTRFYKADLHFHTPASEDARGRNRYNFNPYKTDYPSRKDTAGYRSSLASVQAGILRDARELAGKIVQRFVELDLGLVAVTDHNGIGTIWADDEAERTTMDLAAPTWYELIDDEAQRVNRAAGKRRLTILPGTEISTVGVHILALFAPQQPRRKVHFIICDLLNEAGFAIDDWGRNPKVGTASIVHTMQLIVRKGGVPIIAHIDGSDQALLRLFKINSGAMKNVILNPLLGAVEIVKASRFARKDRKLKKVLKDWIREERMDEGLRDFAYFQGSDAHDIPTVAKRHTFVKMTGPSFDGLKTAMNMPSSRVRISEWYTPVKSGTFIHSITVNNSFLGNRTVRFNRHLNCVLGKKGSGKSVLFDMMQRAAGLDATQSTDSATLVLEQMTDGTSRYCAFDIDGKKKDTAVCGIDPGKKSVKDVPSPQKVRESVSPTFYDSDRIEKLIASAGALDAFLKERFGPPAQATIKRLDDRFAITPFLADKPDRLLAFGARNGAYTLDLNTGWLSGRERMRDLFSLSLSKRRTALFCMIVIMSEFGPTVIDAPEALFDNEDIIAYLVPVIRHFKDEQQVILFTGNPILAVNTDPDNYIVLQTRETRLDDVVSGFAIDDAEHKDLVTDIVEGGITAFQRRGVRYGA